MGGDESGYVAKNVGFQEMSAIQSINGDLAEKRRLRSVMSRVVSKRRDWVVSKTWRRRGNWFCSRMASWRGGWVSRVVRIVRRRMRSSIGVISVESLERRGLMHVGGVACLAVSIDCVSNKEGAGWTDGGTMRYQEF